ncbi:MAG: serine/threonine-protein kinase [Myxococcota bacterium]|nr:serine/threonine-protein kinase [Myxococcota bacterium]
MAAHPTRLRRGSRLGKYRLERLLGRGAFSSVWKVRDTVENRLLALKVAAPELVAAVGRAELEHEARIAARLSHPNIVAMRNADWVDGHFVIAQDLAERNLAHFATARRSPRVGIAVIHDVAAGLAHAHAQRVMHRDVKPENVLIFADRHAALTDFGVSRVATDRTRTVTEAGTLGYMAPEQAYGRPRLCSDVFSLGLIAYELLTGVLPTWPFDWPAPGHDRLVARVPEPYHAVLHKAAAFEPSWRYPDAVALHEALGAAARRVENGRERGRSAPRRSRTRSPVQTPLAVESSLFRRRYGRSLGMRVDCFRCGGPLSESMTHCPWCGTPDNSFRDVSSYPLVCPDCEHGVLPEWTSCPWCYRGRFAGNGRPPRPDPRAERRCTRRGCPGELRPFMRYCPVCKQKPRRLWSHPELKERCPRCRWPVSRTFWRFCPWCGRREPRAGTFH